MQTVTLNGTWQYERKGGAECGPATVPGDIYRDLLDNGQIPDPFYRDNEEYLQWIGESEWTFRRTFDVKPDLLKHDRVMLRCHGLDTLATVTLNGKILAETDNMFRTYEWDVKDLLQSGENSIQVDFASAVKFCDEAYDKHYNKGTLFKNKMHATDATWVRKEQCNFGWDWGIKASTCGIWQDIELVAFDTAWLDDVCIRQTHDNGTVSLAVACQWSQVDGQAPLSVSATVRGQSQIVASTKAVASSDSLEMLLDIPDPKLWWPNNMGDQPLYEVSVDLLDEQGQVLDSTTRRIGLRTLRLGRHSDQWGESFQFVVNGVPFFAKGANWIPADAIQSRMTPARYRELIEDTTAANMNMLRVWGGGIYEDDSFYDACDELGICIWQDFMFGHGHHYPVENETFRSNVGIEARQQVKRLRHHPCIALWCGNNEMEQGAVKP